MDFIVIICDHMEESNNENVVTLITIANTMLGKKATPPNLEETQVCTFLPLGVSINLFFMETNNIFGIRYKVIRKLIRNAVMIIA